MFGPVMHIRKAVSRSMIPSPRIRRTKISFSLRSVMFASICSVAWLIQSRAGS